MNDSLVHLLPGDLGRLGPDSLVICKQSLAPSDDSYLRIKSLMIPRKFRFIDCACVVQKKALVIHDTFMLPTQLYAAVSYPWIGVSCDDIKPIGTAIRPLWKGNGLEGDPISVSLLCSVCRIALSEKIEFLWIDRLCIDQVGEYDKPWQIRHMSEIYRQCKICIIVPGGLQRLAIKSEETPWIKRMWTLQEAILPPKCVVVYTECHSDPQITTQQDLWTALSPARGPNLFDRLGAELLRDVLEHKSTNHLFMEMERWSTEVYIALWKSVFTRVSRENSDILQVTMAIFKIDDSATTISHSNEATEQAFMQEFCKWGMADPRLIAFLIAIYSLPPKRRKFFNEKKGIYYNWEEVLRRFNTSIPLRDTHAYGIKKGTVIFLPNGHPSSGDLGPPILTDGSGESFLGLAFVQSRYRVRKEKKTLKKFALYPCCIRSRGADAQGQRSFTCYFRQMARKMNIREDGNCFLSTQTQWSGLPIVWLGHGL